jgi:O-antigen ligase
MIRYTLLGLAVAFVLGYAWRDWFKSLCAVIIFMAFYERHDMPRSLFGIAGLNLFNIMLANVVLAWIVNRRRENLRWDMPTHVNVLLLLNLGVYLLAFARMMADRQNLEGFTTGELVSLYLLNTLKWVVPGLLLFDGCRTRERFEFALLGTLALYLLLALQVARHISPMVDVDELNRRALNLDRYVGYHRVDLSTMLAGASWAVLAARPLLRGALPRAAVVGVSLVVLYGQLLTAGRAGYVGWVVVGLVLCGLRWRALLPLAAVLVVGIALGLPAVADRVRTGFFGADEGPAVLYEEQEVVDAEKLTAGRSLVWPYAIEKIREQPLHGYGRLAWHRTGVSALTGEYFGHPHNAYLELLLDTGFLGFGVVMAFYGVAAWTALRLFMDSRSPLFIAAGGAAFALIAAQLVGALGSQTFYPRQGTVGMWCAMMLMFRVAVERRKLSGSARRPQRRTSFDPALT